MKQLQQTQHIQLTGNPFADTGLATIAALSNCKNIEDLTVRKMKNMHNDGTKLARTQMRLRSTATIFPDSLITNPSIKKDRGKKYAKITTAILNNIGREHIQERCEICGKSSSIDLDKLFKETLKEKNKEKRHIGREWFPLIGSMGSDAQALPGGSRSLNICATCLFAVQYLPQSVILVKGRLTVFQSTSTAFWYQLIKDIVKDVSSRLAAKDTKVDTIGKKEGSGKVVDRLLLIMKRGIRFDPNTSLITWLFSNFGSKADCEVDEIPNFALNFLHIAAKHGLDSEIRGLIAREKKSYDYSFLNCISKRQDYYNLYPSQKFKNDGASPQLFLLYQTHIRNYPVKSLHTAYKIARYVKSIDENNKLGIDINKDIQKQNRVKKGIIAMAKEGSIIFDEYYDMFASNNLGNPWQLVKYYMLIHDAAQFKEIQENNLNNQEHKNMVVYVGKAIFNSYVERRGADRFKKDVLFRLDHGNIHASWLRDQFEKLTERYDENFDHNHYWKLLCTDENGEDSRSAVYELLYLFRLLWTQWISETIIK